MQPMVRLTVVLAGVGMVGCGGGGTDAPAGGTNNNNPSGVVVSSVAITSASADSLFSFRDSARYSAVARDAAGNPLSNATITWTSSDPSVASVSPATGPSTNVISNANGAAIVTASSGGSSATKVLVIAQRPATIGITPTVPDSIFAFGDGRALSASVRDARGSGISSASVAWSIDKPSVATLSAASGVNTTATSVGNGTAIVTARSGTMVATAGISVRQKVSQVVVTPTTVSISLGATANLSVVPKDSRGNAMVLTTAPRFTSSDSTKARVSDIGVVTAVAPGTATITVTQPTPEGDVRSTVAVTIGSFSTDVTVDLRDSQFSPAIVDLVAGGRVTWQWREQVFHDITGTTAGSPIHSALQGQGSYALTFTTPGRYDYHCTQHSGMTGTIIVH